MINNINQLGTSQTTGSDGTVFFSDLSPDQLYAYRVETGCRNSLLQWTDTATSYDMLRLPLQSGVENEVVAYVVRAGATLKLVNNGPMTYHLGALRSFFRILKPYETTTHHFFLDDYFINVTSPNAPTFSLDTVLSLRCGEITTLTLP